MAKLEWSNDDGTLELWPTAYKLYSTDGKRYATLKYQPWCGSKGMWVVMLRDWGEFQELPGYTEIVAPPKEFVESLVLLAYDIGDING